MKDPRHEHIDWTGKLAYYSTVNDCILKLKLI